MYLLYFVLWMIFNGSVTLEIVIFGLVIAAVIFAFTCAFLGHSISKEISIYKRFGGIFYYICQLVYEIYKANMTVIRMILSEEEELEPTLVSFRTNLKTPFGRAFMANSITLTPGTITVTLEDDEYVVHCLDASLAGGINCSVLEQRLEKLEQI